jgi:pimeloyl-ACP methyl ester carboxylesterase
MRKPVIAGDGTKLYCEERGAGAPVVFVHELAGSCRSFDPQVDAFQDRFRCVAFNARGYPPSDVPMSGESYSQDIAADDIAAVLDCAGLASAHLVGVSMGAASVLQFALKAPRRALSATLAGIGSGSDEPEVFRRTTHEAVRLIETRGMAAYAEHTWASPSRLRLRDKNPSEFRRSHEEIAAMSSPGRMHTMRGVQMQRPTLYAHEKRLASLDVPVLVIVGDEDEACRKPSEFLERTLPDARLHVLPRTGHAVNLEEHAEFNRLWVAFVDEVSVASR